MILSRRKFFTGAALSIAAPAIIRIADIMPIKALALAKPHDWDAVLRGVLAKLDVGDVFEESYPFDWVPIIPASYGRMA